MLSSNILKGHLNIIEFWTMWSQHKQTSIHLIVWLISKRSITIVTFGKCNTTLSLVLLGKYNIYIYVCVLVKMTISTMAKCNNKMLRRKQNYQSQNNISTHTHTQITIHSNETYKKCNAQRQRQQNVYNAHVYYNLLFSIENDSCERLNFEGRQFSLPFFNCFKQTVCLFAYLVGSNCIGIFDR